MSDTPSFGNLSFPGDKRSIEVGPTAGKTKTGWEESNPTDEDREFLADHEGEDAILRVGESDEDINISAKDVHVTETGGLYVETEVESTLDHASQSEP